MPCESKGSLVCCVFLWFSKFVTFPYGVPGRAWCLIVLIPDLCIPLYFQKKSSLSRKFKNEPWIWVRDLAVIVISKTLFEPIFWFS